MARLKEISKACNVSMATVSRVLNNDTTLSVSPEIKDLIIKTAEKLSYKTPRQRALEHKASLKYKAGLILQGIDIMGCDVELAEMLEPIAKDYSIDLSLFSPEDGYDALLLIGSFSSDEIKYYLAYSDKILFINGTDSDYQYDSIAIDYEYSEKLAYNYFKDKGIKRIGYFGGYYKRNGLVLGQKRVEGLKKHLQEDGLYDKSLFHIGEMSKESGRALAENATEIPDGILFGDRQTMEGAMEVLREKDIHPTTLLYENFFIGDYGEDATLIIFSSDVWMTAFRLLKERLDGTRVQGIHVFCPPQLLEISK